MDVADDLSASVSKLVVRPNQQQLLLDAERERRLGAEVALPQAEALELRTEPLVQLAEAAAAGPDRLREVVEHVEHQVVVGGAVLVPLRFQPLDAGAQVVPFLDHRVLGSDSWRSARSSPLSIACTAAVRGGKAMDVNAGTVSRDVARDGRVREISGGWMPRTSVAHPRRDWAADGARGQGVSCCSRNSSFQSVRRRCVVPA
jgi:hypothetical protein